MNVKFQETDDVFFPASLLALAFPGQVNVGGWKSNKRLVNTDVISGACLLSFYCMFAF